MHWDIPPMDIKACSNWLFSWMRPGKQSHPDLKGMRKSISVMTVNILPFRSIGPQPPIINYTFYRVLIYVLHRRTQTIQRKTCTRNLSAMCPHSRSKSRENAQGCCSGVPCLRAAISPVGMLVHRWLMRSPT